MCCLYNMIDSSLEHKANSFARLGFFLMPVFTGFITLFFKPRWWFPSGGAPGPCVWLVTLNQLSCWSRSFLFFFFSTLPWGSSFLPIFTTLVSEPSFFCLSTVAPVCPHCHDVRLLTLGPPSLRFMQSCHLSPTCIFGFFFCSPVRRLRPRQSRSSPTSTPPPPPSPPPFPEQ